MVRTIEGQLVIECENLGSKTANLTDHQSAIINVLHNYTDDCGDKTTAYSLGMIENLIRITGELDLLKIENHELKKEKLTMIVMAKNCNRVCSLCTSKFICPFIKLVNPTM
jgi:hypothetical protein